jgi:hypothetical protein
VNQRDTPRILYILTAMAGILWLVARLLSG